MAISPSWRESQHVRHVVKHIIAPCGPGIEERPPVPTLEERVAAREARRLMLEARRAFRQSCQALAENVQHGLAHAEKYARRATKAIDAWEAREGPASRRSGSVD